jgi:colanic acid/amylovoran biosynthesis glycosyltransferase
VLLKSYNKPLLAVCRYDFLPLSETFVLDQVRNINNWNIHFFYYDLVENGLKSSFPATRVKNVRNPMLLLLNRYMPQIKKWYFNYKCIKKSNPKAVLIHFGVDAISFWPLVRNLKVPVIIYLHGYDIRIRASWWREQYGKTTLGRYQEKLLEIAKKTKVHFLTCSQSLLEDAVLIGIPREKLKVLPLGVDTKLFAPSNKSLKEKYTILFVGRLVEKKGCHLIIEAFKKIHQLYPKSSLKIIGDGPLRYKLQDQARDSGCNIHFLGAMCHTDVAQEMKSARIFCLPSITAKNGDAEGMPVTILEAQSSGIPVVTSAKGGATEGIINGITGFTFEEGNVEKLEKCIINLMSDNKLAEAMGKKGRQNIIQSRGLEVTTAKLEDILNSYIK